MYNKVIRLKDYVASMIRLCSSAAFYAIITLMIRGTTRKNILLAGLITILVIVGFAAGILAAITLGSAPGVKIPVAIEEKVLFPTYLPEPLPKGYTLAENSFHVEEGALLFQITQEQKKISFAEQTKPKDFDFNAFYQQQLTDTKNLRGAPHSSVLGKTQEGSYLLSIVTDETWLLVTTQDAGESDLRFIAEHIKQQ